MLTKTNMRKMQEHYRKGTRVYGTAGETQFIHTREGRDESQVVKLTSAGHIPRCGEGGKYTTKTRQKTAT